jgi:hypothetical protein
MLVIWQCGVCVCVCVCVSEWLQSADGETNKQSVSINKSLNGIEKNSSMILIIIRK